MKNSFDFSQFDNIFGDTNQDINSASTVATATAEPINNPTEEITVMSSDSSNNISILQSAQTKMSQIGVELNQDFVERDELIKIMLLAIATGTNLLMLGPPGTGKSLITYELCNRIQNANYFQWMLNKTSDPSEILGPFSVKEMENDKFLRITTGKQCNVKKLLDFVNNNNLLYLKRKWKKIIY